MIDAHCHLCAPEFDGDLPEVIERAKRVGKQKGNPAGVAACIVNTEDQSEFSRSLELGTAYPGFCIPCAGVHPVQHDITIDKDTGEKIYNSRSANRKDLEGMADWLSENHSKILALGEVGLDFTPRYIHETGDKDEQRFVLKQQIEWAKQYDLPLISHSRSAGKPAIAFYKENQAERVLLHAFDGAAKASLPAVAAGYYFSIPPCICRSEQKQELVKKVPLDNILLETDSPVLGPTKEDRNEPGNMSVSVQWIAKLKNVDEATVRQITTENAHKLFPKLKTFMQIK